MGIPVIAGIVIAIIYDFKEAEKNEEEKIELFEEISKIFDLEFNKREFLDADKEAQAREDCEAFAACDIAIESGRTECSEYDVEINSPIHEYYTKKNDIKKTIDLTEFNNLISDKIGAKIGDILNTELMVLFETNTEGKRIHIRNIQKRIKDDTKFEDVFIDYKDTVLEFDIKNANNYTDVFNRKYNNKEFKNDGNYEYLVLDEKQKELLMDLYKKTKLKFSFSIECGVGRIRVNLNTYIGDLETIKVNEETVKEISDLLIKIIREWQ